MDTISLKGTIAAGPSKADCTSFPSAVVNIGFEIATSNKSASVSCTHKKAVNSVASFVELDGIGEDETVTRATLLYLRTQQEMSVRVSQDDGSGGTVTATYVVNGLFIIEASTSKFIKLLEAQGVGAVEYFASGNQ